MNNNNPSFFEIENRREKLENKLRAESYPVTMAEMAQKAEVMHNIYKKEVDKPKKQITDPNYRISVMKSVRDVLSKPEMEDFSLEVMMENNQEIEVILTKFGSTKGKKFDFSKYMDSFYADRNSWGYFFDAPKRNLVAHTYEKITKRGTEGSGTETEQHLQTVNRNYYEKSVNRLRRLKVEKPWLIEFSEKYIDVLGATFAGNGYRCIEGSEGLNFLDGIEGSGEITHLLLASKSAKQLKPKKEKDFINSIIDIKPLGFLPVYEKEIIDGAEVWNQDFNGWGGHTEAFLFTFTNRESMIGYLNRSFADYEGEAWLIFSEERTRNYLVEKDKSLILTEK